MSDAEQTLRRVSQILSDPDLSTNKADVVKALRLYIEDRLPSPEAPDLGLVKTKLRELQQKLAQEPDQPFQAGDLVTWKEGLKNRRRPKEGDPAVVVETLSEPIMNPANDAGVSVFREPLDIAIAFIDEDGDFPVYYVDSRRLRHL